MKSAALAGIKISPLMHCSTKVEVRGGLKIHCPRAAWDVGEPQKESEKRVYR
jgi:hypothetical protein